jgi:hypothetical protein
MSESFLTFRPRLLDALQDYSWVKLRVDARAGLNVMIIAIPLAIAFAIASGVKPEQWLFTAIIGGGLIAALGGSSVQIGGPTGAFVIITCGILQALEDLHLKLRVKGKHLILSGPHTRPLFAMGKAGFPDRLGRENICPHIDAVLGRACEILGLTAVPEPPDAPGALRAEKEQFRSARRELAEALERTHRILNDPQAPPTGPAERSP